MPEGFKFKAETPEEKKRRQAADPKMAKPESHYGKVIVPGQEIDPNDPEAIGRAMNRHETIDKFVGQVLDRWTRECGAVMDAQLLAFDRQLKAQDARIKEIEEQLGLREPASEETDSPSPD